MTDATPPRGVVAVPAAAPAQNVLYYGDNLDVLRRHIPSESVDLVYLDPPFQSDADYNILFEEHGTGAAAQVRAFEDTWEWNTESAASYQAVVEGGGQVAMAMRAFRTMLGDSDMLAYLSMMAPRLIELHRVLKPTGSLYLHCDPTASHYLKMLLDAVFGPQRFQNEFIWYYSGGGASKRRWARKHDVLLFYTKGKEWTFNADAVRTPYKWTKGQLRADGSGRDLTKGKLADDVWEHHSLMPWAGERLGYPTQKPEALLERIITASSNPGDVVLDPFCGCGTAVAVAQRLDRRWVGIDITHLAIGLIKNRLRTRFGPAASTMYKVVGEPTTVDDAAVLAKEDPFQFQAWALGLVGARPEGETKKGADKGIDGRLYFHDEQAGDTKQIIISVKAGHTGVAHVRDLRGVIDRENAQIGVLLTFEQPTKPMLAEAASAGFYTSPLGSTHPRLQVLTVGEALDGKGISYPRGAVNVTVKAAGRVRPDAEMAGMFDSDD